MALYTTLELQLPHAVLLMSKERALRERCKAQFVLSYSPHILHVLYEFFIIYVKNSIPDDALLKP